jgi:crotonobetainyl-CoA:carnitine CoA-transferase CaiB-like acyl-CoA transferase
MPSLNSSLPLAGVRVLDLSRILAGPWCGMVLADMGAEVIKVEHPGRGDDTRDWGLRVGKTETAYFNSVNRNKRSVTLDLQTPEGQQLARDLAKQCDVLIQNFKFGGIDKLGLGYEQLSKENPRLIYCSISGYDAPAPRPRAPATTSWCRARPA